MSATNRGTVKEENELYQTPSWCVRRLLEAVELPAGTWLEPAAGNGAIMLASRRRDVSWVTVDIADYGGIPLSFQHDFLTWEWKGPKFKVGITNPAFSIAQAYAEKMIQICEVTVLLTRLNWLAGPRADFLRQHPCDVYVLPNRPSFVKGGTDATEYAWLTWNLSEGGHWQLLADTPLAERRLG